MINASYIPLRYARALNEYAKQNSVQEAVYVQCKKALSKFAGFAALRHQHGKCIGKVYGMKSAHGAGFGMGIVNRFLGAGS